MTAVTPVRRCPGTARRALTMALPAVVAALTLACDATKPPVDGPDVVLIVVDTLRADRLGCYGAERDTSPAIDAFAAESVRFDRAYSTSSWTQPAVASMFTGLHPSSHGVTRLRARLGDDAVTLAEALGDRGYTTIAVISHFLIGRKFGFHQGFDLFMEGEAKGHDHVSTAGVTDYAITSLEAFGEEPEPFFLFVHYFDPHFRYVRHPEFGFAPESAGRLTDAGDTELLKGLLEDMTPEEGRFLRDLYDEEVRLTDGGIGRLLDELRRRGLFEDALVILTSDHGEEFLDHGWMMHTRTLYEELVRVPLIVRPPGFTGGGRVISQPVSVVSLMPTVLDFAGVKSPGARMQANSLAGHLGGTDRSRRPAIEIEPGETPGDVDVLDSAAVYSEVDFEPVGSERSVIGPTRKKALVTARWKIIRDDLSGTVEVFDLREDPGETRDLSTERPELTRALAGALEREATRARGDSLSEEQTDLTAEQLEALRALGYVDG